MFNKRRKLITPRIFLISLTRSLLSLVRLALAPPAADADAAPADAAAAE